MLLLEISKKAHPTLRQARALAEGNFQGCCKASSGSFVFLRLRLKRIKRWRISRDWNLNVISRMSWIVEWIGKPPKLTPAIRVGFRDRRNNLLLDSHNGLDDALYLIEE
jgi:hypothetical protein